MSGAAPERSSRFTVASLAVVTVIAGIVALVAVRSTPQQPTSVASASPIATESATQRPAPSSTTSLAATASALAVKPDSQHGLIVPTGNMRTEDNERGLQQPSLFMLAPSSSYSV